MKINIEQKRFIAYQEEYYAHSKTPEPPEFQEPVTPSNKSRRGMATRKSKFGKSGMTEEGQRAVARKTPRTAGQNP